MRRSIGQNTPEVVDVIMFGLLLLVLVAFCILVKNIASDVGEYFFLTEDQIYSDNTKNRFAIGIFLCFVLPLMTLENLYALRYASYVGMTSILLLLGVLLYKCVAETMLNPQRSVDEARAFPTKGQDLLTATPIMLIAFLCQFNAVEVYATLNQPTKETINRVMSTTITFSGLVFTMFGVAGYMIAFDETRDNILSNFSPRDHSLIVARIGLVFTLICQLPMIGVPCRDLALMIYGHTLRLCQNRRTRSASILYRESQRDYRDTPSPLLFDSPLFGGDGSLHSGPISKILSRSGSGVGDQQQRTASADSVPFANDMLTRTEELRCASAASSASVGNATATAGNSSSSSSSSRGVGGRNRTRTLSMTGIDPPETKLHASRVVSAVLVVLVALLLGELVPGVAIIWTIAGSSVALLLAFILPSVAYIELWKNFNETHEGGAGREFKWRSVAFWREAWGEDRDLVYCSVLLVVSCVLAVVCTYWSVHRNT
jgi:amino acid permease